MDHRGPVDEQAARSAGSASTGQMAGSAARSPRWRALAVWLRRPAGAAGRRCPSSVAWLLSPAIAHWVSRGAAPMPAARRFRRPTPSRCGLIARRTWRFFETFVTPADNMLPPDNFQEDPAPVVAHRTSPTNIGLLLLSTVAARDFGWIGTLEAVERLEATLPTVGRLKRFRGHFFNWYDTSDLRPLDPAYVSSVDSGNLAGHLIALANTCAGVARRPRRRAVAARRGCGDTLTLAREAFERCPTTGARSSSPRRDWPARLDELAGGAAQLPRRAGRPVRFTPRRPPTGAHARRRARPTPRARTMLFWVEAAQRSIESHRRDLEADRRSACRAGSPPAGHRRPTRPRRWRTPWSSPSCSTASASCSRSAMSRPRTRSIPAATTCSPRRRAWPASFAIAKGDVADRATGSGSGARRRRSAAARRWSPGRARCSST